MEPAPRRAAIPPQDGELLPPVEETPLAPEKQALIDRAWNEYAASPPTEQDRARERGPRITQL
jgi:hypothetical protein